MVEKLAVHVHNVFNTHLLDCLQHVVVEFELQQAPYIVIGALIAGLSPFRGIYGRGWCLTAVRTRFGHI